MDTLETVIHSAGAAKYLQAFKTKNIEINDVKFLSDDDLLEFGVKEEVIRRKLLENFRNLQLKVKYVNWI